MAKEKKMERERKEHNIERKEKIKHKFGNCNRFASPASPGVWLMCAELMLAVLTMLLLAGLNSFPGFDIIEYRLYGKSQIFHIPFSKLA